MTTKMQFNLHCKIVPLVIWCTLCKCLHMKNCFLEENDLIAAKLKGTMYPKIKMMS